MKFYRAATVLADAMIAGFYDQAGGAFFDTAAPAEGDLPLGALGARRKPLQDTPTPAGNPTAAAALLRLASLSGRRQYGEVAEETLISFAGVVEHFGLYAGSYGLALERMLEDPIQVVVVGSGLAGDELEVSALAHYAVNKTVIRIEARPSRGELPEAMAEILYNVRPPARKKVWAVVCRGRTCLPPVSDPAELLEALAQRA